MENGNQLTVMVNYLLKENILMVFQLKNTLLTILMEKLNILDHTQMEKKMENGKNIILREKLF